MRTTILLSSLLFLAGSALAQQDSPITVGDSGRIPGLPGGKAATRSASTYVGHSQFRYDGPNKVHHVAEAGYQAGCFDIDPRPAKFTPVNLVGKTWTLDLDDGSGSVRLMQLLNLNKPERIEIILDKHQVIARSPAAGRLSLEMVGYALTSATLTVGNNKLPAYPYSSGSNFVIHYCPGGACPSPDPCK
jgi:hypothetical protein